MQSAQLIGRPKLRTRPKTPAYLYAAIFAVLLILLSAFALTARQPPPPTIAEFAPQATEQIKDAPSEQSSEFGSGAGEGDCPPGAVCGPGGAGSGATGLEEPIEVPRVRKCVGDPPRQIEDPQSPPCVPYWAGDNGGATSKGVTRDEIRVVIPEEGEDDTNRVLIAFFNKRFEFYGRKITIIDLNKSDGDNPASQTAAAAAADEEHKAFASLRWNSSNSFYYYQELARRKIIAVGAWPDFTEEYMKRYHPYLWQYPMGIDRMFMNMGEWGCKRLAGLPAEHAGDPTMQSKQRVFGIIVQATNNTNDYDIDHAPLARQLEACGYPAKRIQPKYYQQDDTIMARNIMVDMQDAGVTSIFCLCHVYGMGFLTKAATGQAYYPEWMTTTYNLMDYNWAIRTFIGQDQRKSLLGLTFIPRQLDPNDHPARWAQKEMEEDAPQFEDGFIELARSYKYQHMLLLASGLQMAGPNLTPESFERGLHQAKFPNPDHPNMPGKVGFPNEHGMTRDGAEFYWSESGRSPFRDEQNGTICYVHGGRRYSLGNWPTGRGPFFEGPCDSGAKV